MDLPVRQAFHALHDQGIASAPVWDATEGAITGVLSASDFIHILRRLRSAVSSGSNPMSEQEMDAHTVGDGEGEDCAEVLVDGWEEALLSMVTVTCVLDTLRSMHIMQQFAQCFEQQALPT